MGRFSLIGAALVALSLVAALLFADKQSGAVTLRDQGGLPTEIDVSASPLPLDLPATILDDRRKVRFEGGWALSSDHPDFGGFSGLLVDAAEKTLLAISDKGDWWQARFDPLRATPPTGGSMRGYSTGAIADKIDLDAESLVRFNNGYLVSFEQNHRLEFISEVGGRPSPMAELAPIDFSGVSNNSGMEAIALLPSGQLLAFAERGMDTRGRLKVWLVSSDSVTDLFFLPPRNFAPTDAATLPNGDVLLLLRRYSPVDGVTVRLHHIVAANIVKGGLLEGRQVLELTPDGPVDNMEGLDIVPLDQDTVRLVMISDDNFNPLQRTLLMMFDYDYR